MFQALIGPIANLAGAWFENKVEKTKADGAAKVAEAKARATVAEESYIRSELNGKAARWRMLQWILGKTSSP